MNPDAVIPPAIIDAARTELDEWRREAKGSRAAQANYEQTANKHRADAERAEAHVAALVDALRSIGVEA